MSDSSDRRPLVEGIDFYMEGPYMVFTADYLRRRGYCCESGCRHCPWDFRSTTRGDQAGFPSVPDDDQERES